jgi:hypothetical protein
MKPCLGQHPGKHVEAGTNLPPVPLAIFSAESLGGDLLAHAHSIGQTARGRRPSAPACVCTAAAPQSRSAILWGVNLRPAHVLTAPVAAWRAFRRLTQLSFPRSYPIVQFPNAPLILAFASGLVASYSHGHEHSDAQAVSYLSMAIWAYLELFHGVNMFRRLLGLAYTLSTAVHLASALHH